MRVSLVALHFPEYAARLALHLAETCDVQLHLTRPRCDLEISPELMAQLKARVELHVHERIRKYNEIARGWSLSRAIRAFAPDVVHAQEAGVRALAVMLLALPRALPFVLTVHDPVPHSGADQVVRNRRKREHEFIRRRADRILVHDSICLGDMVRLDPAKAGRVHVAAHGVLAEAPDEDVAPETGSFVFFGRIEAYKGLGVLLAACRKLSERGLPYRLLILGRGPDLEPLRGEIAALPNVALDEAFVPAAEVGQALRKGAVVVMPYLDATQSGVLASAFSVGRPVIATRVGGLPEIVVDGDNGLLAPPNDVEALAAAMARVIREPELAGHLAAGAVQTAQTKLSWTHIARDTRRVYELARADAGRRGAPKAAETRFQDDRSGL